MGNAPITARCEPPNRGCAGEEVLLGVLSSSLRNPLRQREKLANPSIHDFATTS